MKTSDVNCFWWDNGFESVQNCSDSARNPREIAHVVSPCYRLDISRQEGAPVGLEVFHDCDYRHGLVLPPPPVGLSLALCATIGAVQYRTDPSRDMSKSLMVYDAGKNCHQLRLKGCALYDERGNAAPGIEVEQIYYLWRELLAISFHLVDADTRLPLRGQTLHLQASLTCSGGALRRTPEGGVWLGCKTGGALFAAEEDVVLDTEQDRLILDTQGGILALCVEPLHHAQDSTLKQAGQTVCVTLRDRKRGSQICGRYDPIVGGWVLPFDACEAEMYTISASTTSARELPVRVLLTKEDTARLLPDGAVVPMEQLSPFNPMGSYLFATDNEGAPTGTAWQISIDGHEFEQYPRPYTHRWIHFYAGFTCSRDAPFAETLRIGNGTLDGAPIASFCQLSLLGWDDNPHYGNPRDATAVQLWIQGLIGRQEILCVCPESHMTDNTITDIRPIDAGHTWGPNNGGGDFLRYRVPGDATLRKLCATRCDFVSYGPLWSCVDYYMTSEDGAISGVVRSSMAMSRDVARVYFSAEYTLLRDLRVEELTLAWLGCPGYDRSRYARYAWGVGAEVCQDALVEVAQGIGGSLIQQAVAPNSWYCSYGGGIIDEQQREPNGNKGMICRGSELRLADAPRCRLQAKRLRTAPFDGITSQFWLGLYPDEQPLQLRKGDVLKIDWEYVPTVKFQRDCAPTEAAYCSLLQRFPDTPEPIRYEAVQGDFTVEALQGAVAARLPVPVLLAQETSRGAAGRYRLCCGVGYQPVQVRLSCKPKHIALSLRAGRSKWAHSIAYQLHSEAEFWMVTAVLQTHQEAAATECTACELTLTAIF